MHYYQFNIADFALHTSHLSLEEEGVYRRLLDYYYDTESAIPKETQSVIRRLRLGSHVETVALILNEFFVLQGDGWHNLRADCEINEYKKKAETARKNGKKGGRPKKNGGKETQSVILANQEETGSKANQELLTKNHKPRTKNHKPVNSVDYSPLNLAQSHIDEIIRIRKKNSKSAKAAVISQRIVNTMVKEFDLAYEAGYSIDNILDCWDNTTWQSFRFEWMVNRIGKSPVLQASENREQELQEWFNSSNQSGRKNTIDNDSGELL
jgi:uncharacterized protein YdaU (DUF1376 family)